MSVSTTWGAPDTKVTYGNEERREKEGNKDGEEDKQRRSHGRSQHHKFTSLIGSLVVIVNLHIALNK